jgi:L-asparaginase
MFPAMNEAAVNHIFSYAKLKGIILETYGSGNLTNAPWFIDALKKLGARGIPIVNVTQCSGGSVAMGLYETSTELKKLGVISGKDITTEAAIAKLMYLLGKGVSSEELKALFETSLRGEMS